MRRYYKLAALSLLLIFSSCTTEEIIFPDAVEDQNKGGLIDVIVKPTDVNVEGTYDQSFIIKWPKFSSKIDKVIVTYEDNNEIITKEVTEFSSDLRITTLEIKKYQFTFKSISKDGRETAAVLKEAENKGLYIQEVIDRSSVVGEGRLINVNLLNPLKSTLKYLIDYQGASGVISKTINSSEESTIFKFNGAFGNNIKITIEDENGNIVTKEDEYEISPKIYSTSTDKVFWTPYTNTPDLGNSGWSQANLFNGTINEYGALLNWVTGLEWSVNYIHFTTARINSPSTYNSEEQKHPEGPFDVIFVTGTTFHIDGNSAWGQIPTDLVVYGVKKDRSEVLIKTVTGNAARTVIVDFEGKSDEYIGIRYDMKGFTRANMSEIDIAGFPDQEMPEE